MRCRVRPPALGAANRPLLPRTARSRLRGICWRSMGKRGPAFINVGDTGCLKALRTIRTSAHDVGVMIVLPVVLPPALLADFVPTPFGESDAPAARTRVRTTRVAGEDVPLFGVHLEPSGSLGDQLLVRQRRVVVGSPDDRRVLGFRPSTTTEPGHAPSVA